jgi:hypothetical protein
MLHHASNGRRNMNWVFKAGAAIVLAYGPMPAASGPAAAADHGDDQPVTRPCSSPPCRISSRLHDQQPLGPDATIGPSGSHGCRSPAPGRLCNTGYAGCG